MPIVVSSFILACVVLFFAIPDPTPYLVSPIELLYHPSLAHAAKALLAGLLHRDLGHLSGNMILFSLAGFPVERKLGSLKTLGLIVVSGLCALALHVGSDPYSPTLFLGASGVLFGVLATHSATC